MAASSCYASSFGVRRRFPSTAVTKGPHARTAPTMEHPGTQPTPTRAPGRSPTASSSLGAPAWPQRRSAPCRPLPPDLGPPKLSASAGAGEPQALVRRPGCEHSGDAAHVAALVLDVRRAGVTSETFHYGKLCLLKPLVFATPLAWRRVRTRLTAPTGLAAHQRRSRRRRGHRADRHPAVASGTSEASKTFRT